MIKYLKILNDKAQISNHPPAGGLIFEILFFMFYLILKELFYALTGALAIFIIMEIFWPGIVLAYININWVLIFWLVIGIVILITNSKWQITIIK
ncbi:MAG: hypothetical protein U9R14_02875 [Patescibacteria group bacterium]|nr:hypothetical protein [Patescibacteria group bacterium]